jgi:hypothetical protein
MAAKPRRRAANSSEPPVRSAEELEAAAIEILRGSLQPFVRTLSQDELSAMPAAAAALARRPGGARRVVVQHPAQPVEVVLARHRRQIVGVLLMRRRWMEQTFESSQRNDAPDPPRKTFSLNNWLTGFDARLGSWLAREIEFSDVDEGQFYDEHGVVNVDGFLDFLDYTRNNWPDDQLTRFLSLPIAQRWLVYARSGNSQQRRRLDELLKSQRPQTRGAPEKARSELRAVQIAAAIEDAKARLEDGVKCLRAMFRPGRYNDMPSIRQALQALPNAYKDDEVEAIIVGKTRVGAAYHHAAAKFRLTIRSVRAMASRGRSGGRSRR